MSDDRSIWTVWNNSDPDGAYYILGAFSTKEQAQAFETEMNDREYLCTHIEEIEIDPPRDKWPGKTREQLDAERCDYEERKAAGRLTDGEKRAEIMADFMAPLYREALERLCLGAGVGR